MDQENAQIDFEKTSFFLKKVRNYRDVGADVVKKFSLPVKSW